MRKSLIGCLSVVAMTAVAVPGMARGAAPGPRFGAAVKLTREKGFGGYEPSIVVDRYGNVVVTAHKQNHGLVASPDSQATTQVRSQSWIWWSKDGKTFGDMPGLSAAMEQNAEFGDEGDVATDETGHVYFVDTNVVDNSFTRWKATGNGKLAMEATRPVGPFGEPVDDRPWIAAHGDGVVMYIGNQGDKVSYPGGTVNGGDGEAYGPGRYTAYLSYNHGDTFDPLGITLAGSGWCRPAADHRAGSKLLYVLCTDDGGANDVNENAGDPGFEKGTLYSYVSADDGKTWTRSVMGHYGAGDPWTTYPSVAVAKDGTVYALYNDNEFTKGCTATTAQTTGCDDTIQASHLKLYTSTNHGKTWKMRDVTPARGLIRYSWLATAPDGTLGIAYYFRPNKSADWYLQAGTAKPGQAFKVASVAPKMPVAPKNFGSPFGDFFQCAFGPDNKLNVTWTTMNGDLGGITGLNTDIYYARQV